MSLSQHVGVLLNETSTRSRKRISKAVLLTKDSSHLSISTSHSQYKFSPKKPKHYRAFNTREFPCGTPRISPLSLQKHSYTTKQNKLNRVLDLFLSQHACYSLPMPFSSSSSRLSLPSSSRRVCIPLVLPGSPRQRPSVRPSTTLARSRSDRDVFCAQKGTSIL